MQLNAASAKRPFLEPVHAFRAVAIAIIVVGHAVPCFDWRSRPQLEALLLDLWSNGTVLFVFVAGYLFEYHSPGYRYISYLRKKFLYVVIPYVLVEAPAVIITLVRSSPDPGALALRDWVHRILWFYTHPALTINFPLWFIPMIVAYYVLAPFFMLFVRWPRLYALLPALLCVSALAHRPVVLSEISQPGVYFLSAYVAGMWASHSRQWLDPLLRRHAVALAAMFVVSVAACTLLLAHHGNYESLRLFSREHGWIDWVFLQKLLLSFALLGVLGRVVKRRIRALAVVADQSFSIYFLHYYVLIAFQACFDPDVPVGTLMGLLGLTAVVFAATIAVVSLLGRLVGDHRRWLVGS